MLNSAILIKDQVESTPKKSRSLLWYHNNKEKVSAYKKAHYLKNSDKYKEAAKKYGKSDTRKDYLKRTEEQRKEYNKKRWLRIKDLKPHLVIYGLTIDDYNKMLVAQNNCCAGCKKNSLSLSKPLCVDHCHITNKVRGLLCDSCNKALGLLKDDPSVLFNLINYLKNA